MLESNINHFICTQLNGFKYRYMTLPVQFRYTIKEFQELLINTFNSIHYYSFVCTPLNGLKKKDQNHVHKISAYIFLNHSSIFPKKTFIPDLIHLWVLKESDEPILDTSPLLTKRNHATELFLYSTKIWEVPRCQAKTHYPFFIHQRKKKEFTTTEIKQSTSERKQQQQHSEFLCILFNLNNKSLF